MNFKTIISPVLQELANTILQLSNEHYSQKSNLLNGSSIGGHTRHVIELFQCLLTGYNTGIVNYESRKRNLVLESNIDAASAALRSIASEISIPNKTLILQGMFAENEIDEFDIQTNYYREIIYNLEHSIHHMALIRVAVNELTNITLSETFGVAPSTLQYKKQLCAQ
jgi:hypothetical protein